MSSARIRRSELPTSFSRASRRAFKSTFSESQREAHGLINIAGMLGLSGLVRACRLIAEFAPSQESDCGGKALRELRQAQRIARKTIAKQLLPKLRRRSGPTGAAARVICSAAEP